MVRVHVQVAALIAAHSASSSGTYTVSFGVLAVDLSVLNEIVHLKDLVAGLGIQVHVVVADLVHVTVTSHVEVGRHELIRVLVRDVGKSAVVERHCVSGARDLPWIGTLEIEPVHGVRDLGWSLRNGGCIAISLLLNQSRGVRVLNPWIGAFRPAPTASGYVCRAPLAVRGDHGATGVEHLKEATVIMTQLVAVLLLVEHIRLARVRRAARALVLHRSQHFLIDQDVLGPLACHLIGYLAPGDRRYLRRRGRERQLVL